MFQNMFTFLVGHFHKFVDFLHVWLFSMPLTQKVFFFCVSSCLFLDILIFCFLSWTSVFPLCLLFYCPFFECVCLFKILFDLIILVLPFLYFLLLYTFLSFQKPRFSEQFPFLLFFFERKKRCFLLLPVFSTSLRKTFFIENLCWLLLKLPFFWKKKLHFHHHQCNMFPFLNVCFAS